jgi:hypothetical protein
VSLAVLANCIDKEFIERAERKEPSNQKESKAKNSILTARLKKITGDLTCADFAHALVLRNPSSVI